MKIWFLGVSEVYNAKEKIENNKDSIYVWTGDNIYSCYEKFQNGR